MVGNKFGKRFKEVRTQNGYTQKTFCEAFNANENITTIDSVKNWEQGKCVPEINTILKLCDFFECEMDYLFGKISCKSHDLQFICDETGLSEQAVQKLIEFNYDGDVSSFISKLITHRDGNTLEGLAVDAKLIEENCVALSKGQINGFDSHMLGNAIYGYLFECQSYIQRFIKEQYLKKDVENSDKS